VPLPTQVVDSKAVARQLRYRRVQVQLIAGPNQRCRQFA
jgi:hypothetical protein